MPGDSISRRPGLSSYAKCRDPRGALARLGTDSLPVSQALATGDALAVGMALGGVAGSVGANLLAAELDRLGQPKQAAQAATADRPDAAAFRAALDAVLNELKVIQTAEAGMSDADRAWFAQPLRAELGAILPQLSHTQTILGDLIQASGQARVAKVQTGPISERGRVYVTTGDLTVYEAAGEAEPDLATLEKAYLARIQADCRELPLSALDPKMADPTQGGMGLADVYITLDTTHHVPIKGRQPAKRRTPDLEALREESRPLPVLEATSQERRLVLERLGEPRVRRQDVEAAMNELAYRAHAAGGQAQGPAASPWSLLVEVLEPVVGLTRLAVFEQYARERSGLLLERGAAHGKPVYAFPHRTFQEYLAAGHLAAAAEVGELACTLAAQGDHWREVIRLAAERLVRQGERERPLSMAQALGLAQTATGTPDWGTAILAGEVLLALGEATAVRTATGRQVWRSAQEPEGFALLGHGFSLGLPG